MSTSIGTAHAHRTALVVPLLVLVLTTTVAALVVADVDSPVRAALVGIWVLTAPGVVVVDAWDLTRGALRAALVVAVSTSLATMVLMVQLYSGLWSTSTAFVVLASATYLGAATVLTLRIRAARRAGR